MSSPQPPLQFATSDVEGYEAECTSPRCWPVCKAPDSTEQLELAVSRVHAHRKMSGEHGPEPRDKHARSRQTAQSRGPPNAFAEALGPAKMLARLQSLVARISFCFRMLAKIRDHSVSMAAFPLLRRASARLGLCCLLERGQERMCLGLWTSKADQKGPAGTFPSRRHPTSRRDGAWC